MGCCACNAQGNPLKTSYEEAWQFFIKSQLSRPDKFQANKQKFFDFLYLSILIPYETYILAQIDDFANMIGPGNQKKMIEYIRTEKNKLMSEKRELQRSRQKFYLKLVKIQRDIHPHGVQNQNVQKINQSSEIQQARNTSKEEKKKLQQHNSPQIMARVSSSFTEGVVIQFGTSYSIPRTILGAKDEHLYSSFAKQTQETDYQSISKSKIIETLQFQREKREALEKRILILEQNLADLYKNMSKLQRVKEELIKQCEMKDNLCTCLQQQIQECSQRLRVEKEAKSDQLTSLEIQISTYKDQLSKMSKYTQELSIGNKILQKKITALNETLNSSSTMSKSGEESMKILNELINHPQRMNIFTQCISYKIEPTQYRGRSFNTEHPLKHTHSFIIVQSDSPPSSQGELKERNYQILFNLFPNSKILPNHSEFQLAVGTRTIISEMFDIKMMRTELLYTYDQITPIHYSKYINNKQNLLILIKLKTGITLGAFAGRFIANNEVSQSMIFSISPQREPMKLTTTKRIKRIDYDISYLIFGTGQLRIKARTLDLNCSIGSFQSIYTWGKRSVPIQKFLGTTERSLSMISYEIHQIFFEQLQE